MSTVRRERSPGWVTALLLAVAGIMALLAVGTAVSASEQSGLPVARVPVVAVEHGSCGRSGPCTRPVVLLPGTDAASVVDGIHWPPGAADRVGSSIEVRYDARADQAWAPRDLPLTVAVGTVCAVLAAASAAAAALSRARP
jgi:hypothetical protein